MSTLTHAVILGPCPTEDSTDCFWDAAVQGNGHGQSFAQVTGQPTHYIDMSVYPAGTAIVHVEYTPTNPAHYVGAIEWGVLVDFPEVSTSVPVEPHLPATGGMPVDPSLALPLAILLVVGGTLLVSAARRRRSHKTTAKESS